MDIYKNKSSMDVVVCGEVLLLKHEWRIHFKCGYCEKEIQRLEQLMRHILYRHLPAEVPGELEDLLKHINIEETSTERNEEWLENVKMQETLTSTDETFVDNCEDEEATNKKKSIDFIKCYEQFLTGTRVESAKEQPTDDASGLDDKPTSEESSSETIDIKIEILDDPGGAEAVDIVSVDTVEVKICNEADKDYESAFLCEICNRAFNTHDKLQAHSQRHFSARTFACEYCDARFTFKSNYTVHRNRHLGIKKHACTLCEKSFSSTTEQKLHMRSHTGERPFVCADCDKAFTSSAHLTSHRRRHSNERPYICNICAKGFYDRKLLRNHMPTHSKERPFVCSVCNVRFARLKALNQHLQLHSTVKQYCCKYCLQRFAQNAGLHAHLKKAHADKI